MSSQNNTNKKIFYKYFLYCSFIVLFVCSTRSLSAQNTFNHRYDYGKAATQNRSIVATDSCYYVTGIVLDFNTDVELGTFFARFDLEGNLVFQKYLEDSDRTYETWEANLRTLPDGDFLVSGESRMSGQMLGLLIKYNTNGDTLWVGEYEKPTFYEGSNFFRIYTFKQSLDGGFLLGGDEDNGLNNADVFLIKTDAYGELEWSKTFFTSIIPSKY